MKSFLIGVLVLASLLSGVVFSAQSGENVPEIIRFPARMGEVVFSHADHEAWVTDCTSCHHVGGFVSCGECHVERPGMRRRTDALHMQCQGCHRDQGLTTRCTDCHTR